MKTEKSEEQIIMKPNLKPFKRFIVVEKESGRPMAFGKDQFHYCTADYWEDEHFPLKSYTYSMAHKLITKSHLFRKRKCMTLTHYQLVPFVK